jgi:hypothetical protein
MPIVVQKNVSAAQPQTALEQPPPAKRQQYSGGWLLVLTGFFTAIAGCASAAIGTCQAKFTPYYFDPVVYQYHCAELYWNILGSNNLSAALYEIGHNAFYPLRTLPLALLCPAVLRSPLTPLATALPALALLIFLTGYTVHQRSGSKSLACATAALLTSLPAIYHITYGIHAFWLDVLAALLMGSAFLCLVNYKYSSKRRWLIGLASCVSAMAMSRYVSIVYAAICLYPLLLLTIVSKHRTEKWTGARLGQHAALSLLLPVALCGWFLLFNAPEAYRYYHEQCYSLGSSLETSVSNLFPFLCVQLFSGPLALSLTVIWCINFFASWREKRNAPWDAAWFVFPFASFLLLNLCILRPWETGYIMWYAVPLFFVAVVTPYAALPPHLLKLLRNIMVALAIPSLLWATTTNYHAATSPDGEHRAIKAFDRELAHELVSAGPHSVLAAYFGEYSVVPLVEAFYESGALPRTPAELTFSVHAEFWQIKYPNQSVPQICSAVWALTNEKVQYAAALADPGRALSAETTWFDNATTRQVAFHIAEQLKADRRWQLVRTINHPHFGQVALYRNLHFSQ